MKDITISAIKNLSLNILKSGERVFHFVSGDGKTQFLSVGYVPMTADGVESEIGCDYCFYSVDGGKTFYQSELLGFKGIIDDYKASYSLPQLKKEVHLERKKNVMKIVDGECTIQLEQIKPSTDGAKFLSLPLSVKEPEYLFRFKNRDSYIFVDGGKYNGSYKDFRCFIGKKDDMKEWKNIRVDKYRDGGTMIMKIESPDGVKAVLHSPTPLRDDPDPATFKVEGQQKEILEEIPSEGAAIAQSNNVYFLLLAD